MLMECADFIEPPFNAEESASSSEQDGDDENPESVSIFGPYDDDVLEDGDEEEEDENE